MSYYIFDCHKNNELKLEEIFNKNLNYIQYIVRDSKISGFLMKKSIIKAKDLKNELNIVLYKGDPYEMYKKRERCPSMQWFGNYKPRNLIKAKEKYTRQSKKKTKTITAKVEEKKVEEQQTFEDKYITSNIKNNDVYYFIKKTNPNCQDKTYRNMFDKLKRLENRFKHDRELSDMHDKKGIFDYLITHYFSSEIQDNPKLKQNISEFLETNFVK